IRVYAVRIERQSEPPRPVESSADAERSSMGSATTDPRGEYRLSGLRSGGYEVEVWDPSRKEIAGFALAEFMVGKPVRLRNFRLMAGVFLDVLVTDLHSGAPLEGIHLRNFGPHHPEGSLLSLFSAVTGPNGRCQFRVMPGPNELVAI